MLTTRALRLYGENDIRLEEFALPAIKEGEIMAKVITDSLCMSTYKAVYMGERHNRVPKDVMKNPIMLGHEFCGEIVEVGAKWRDSFREGDKFVIQPALNYKGQIDAPGYSFPYIGGCATYIIIPEQVMEAGCLLPYCNDAFFYGSLAEPVSCVIGSFEEFFHTKAGTHAHIMGVRPGGNMAILAGCGPMGYSALDYALHCERRPGRIVVTDIDAARLTRQERLLSVEDAAKQGIELVYLNTSVLKDPIKTLMELTGGYGYDDVLVMVPVRSVVEQADAILAFNGCLSFFAGPSDTEFSATINFYDVHYNASHIIGTVGGNSDDMRKALAMMEKGLINPAGMVTHVGGLDCAAEATLNLPQIPGGKKLIYTQISMPLTAIEDFAELGKTDPGMKALAEIIERHNGLWSAEAEHYLLENCNMFKTK